MLDKEISEALDIAVNTVASHKEHIYEKTGTRTKVEIAVFASKHNLL